MPSDARDAVRVMRNLLNSEEQRLNGHVAAS
jgi:hypothetical protein